MCGGLGSQHAPSLALGKCSWMAASPHCQPIAKGFALPQFAFVSASFFVTFVCHFCHFVELPRAAVRILSNMTFLFVSLSYTAESAIVTAFITFIPKFIESQFGIPASNASIYTGKALPQSRTSQGLVSSYQGEESM